MLAVVVLVFRWITPAGPSGTASPAVGKPLELTHLNPLTAGTERLTADDLRGKVTIVNFWGYWCGPCIQELPELLELRQSLRAHDDFLFVSVACHPTPTGEMRVLRERTHTLLDHLSTQSPRLEWQFPIHSDLAAEARLALARAAGLQDSLPFPATVLLDRQRVIRGLWLGYSRQGMRELRAEAYRLLAAGQN